MRSAERISLTPGEWANLQRSERARLRREVLVMLCRAREERAEWYVWVLNHRRGAS